MTVLIETLLKSLLCPVLFLFSRMEVPRNGARAAGDTVPQDNKVLKNTARFSTKMHKIKKFGRCFTHTGTLLAALTHL